MKPIWLLDGLEYDADVCPRCLTVHNLEFDLLKNPSSEQGSPTHWALCRKENQPALVRMATRRM